jgi:hypothetical protein
VHSINSMVEDPLRPGWAQNRRLIDDGDVKCHGTEAFI